MSRTAKTAGSARPTYYEVVLEGNPDRTEGLLTGLRLGADLENEPFFSDEAGVDLGSFGEKIGRIVGRHAAISHVLVDKPMRDLLKRHAKRIDAECGVQVRSAKRVKSARFEFSYHAYARQYGREIQKLLGRLPAGLKITGGEPREKVDESARGVEVYSPTHHYEIEAEGTISGRLDLLIEARAELDEHPLVRAETIQLDFA